MKPSVYKDIPLKTSLADRADDWKTAYPRPSLRRADETCRILSEWDLACIHEKNGAKTPLGSIRLPFPPESPLSGIGMTLDDGEAWLYECAFSLS